MADVKSKVRGAHSPTIIVSRFNTDSIAIQNLYELLGNSCLPRLRMRSSLTL
jgi:hypothetical protein